MVLPVFLLSILQKPETQQKNMPVWKTVNTNDAPKHSFHTTAGPPQLKGYKRVQFEKINTKRKI